MPPIRTGLLAKRAVARSARNQAAIRDHRAAPLIARRRNMPIEAQLRTYRNERRDTQAEDDVGRQLCQVALEARSDDDVQQVVALPEQSDLGRRSLNSAVAAPESPPLTAGSAPPATAKFAVTAALRRPAGPHRYDC